jgi:hypothetical protein
VPVGAGVGRAGASAGAAGVVFTAAVSRGALSPAAGVGFSSLSKRNLPES